MINIKKIIEHINKKNSTIQKSFFEIVHNININLEEKNDVYVNWLNSFIYSYGDLSKKDNTANSKMCVERINKLYNLNIKNDNIYKFIFSLQAAYTTLLKLIVFDSFLDDKKLNFNKKQFISLMNGESIEKAIGKKIWSIDWFFIITNYWDKIGTSINNFNYDILEYKDNEKIDYSVAEEFKKLYEYLFPKEIRHSLGEYYTPFWLADDIYKNISENNIINRYAFPHGR